ncbi:MAG: lipopolysaccharide heptosyltransferase II [Bacteroidetes bacterium]|nr:lipopolysaccharide heptosyltransferase II [Bacteroidota bacterium]
MTINRQFKILVIALSGIGDALMFTPALKLLKQKYPDADIHLLSMFKGVEELYKRNADIGKIYFWDFLKSNLLSSLLFVLKLRHNNYDISINVYPANRWHYNLISFIIGAKKRLGHDYNHLNFRSLNFLNNIRIREDDLRHNVEENVRLTSLIGVGNPDKIPLLQIHLTEDDKIAAENWLVENNLSNSVLIGFHAGSALLKNHIKRRWDPEKFAKLGRELMEKYSAKVLLFGGPDEYELNDRINSMMDGKAHIVKVPNLMTSVALMKKCSVFIVNDSGLMHIAAGLQIPIVTIFAYTNPNYVYPWQTRYIMVRRSLECSPCFYYSARPASCKWKEDKFRCITQIGVDEVLSAVEKMLCR